MGKRLCYNCAHYGDCLKVFKWEQVSERSHECQYKPSRWTRKLNKWMGIRRSRYDELLHESCDLQHTNNKCDQLSAALHLACDRIAYHLGTPLCDLHDVALTDIDKQLSQDWYDNLLKLADETHKAAEEKRYEEICAKYGVTAKEAPTHHA